jgi:hypothetical protein
VRDRNPPLLASKPLGSIYPRGFIFVTLSLPGRLRKNPLFVIQVEIGLPPQGKAARPNSQLYRIVI